MVYLVIIFIIRSCFWCQVCIYYYYYLFFFFFWLIKIIWGHIQSNIQIICFDNSMLIPGSWILLEKLLHRQKHLFPKRLLHRSLKDVCRIGEIMFQTEQKDKCLVVDNNQRDMTKPTMWLCGQRRFRSAWAHSHFVGFIMLRLNIVFCR